MGGHAELTAIAIVGLAALICGMVMTRLRLPPVAGYILAGILLGPTAIGLVANENQIQLLAHLGVLMLLFMIGMELHVVDFMKVWRLALLAVAGQIACFLLITVGLSALLGWPLELAVVLAFVAALSSTAVALKMLEEIGEGGSETGRLSVAILIAQDLAVVPMLLVVNDIAGGGFSAAAIGKVIVATAVITGVMVYLARKGRFRLPFTHQIAMHPQLRPIGAVALCLAAATLAGLVGFSAAYGAFLAGLVLGNARGLRPMITAAKPIEGLLMMVFFLSIGLLIDLDYIWANLGEVLLWLVVVTLLKTVLNIGLIRILGQPWHRAFLAGVLLGQIGEFSFLIAATAAAAGLVPPEQSRLIVAIVALSLLISPLWLVAARRLHALAARRRRTLALILSNLFSPETKWLAAEFARNAARIGPLLGHAGKGLARVSSRAVRSRRRPGSPAAKAEAGGAGAGAPAKDA